MSPADRVDPTVAGAAVAVLVAALGWAGTRKSRPEASGMLVAAAVDLARAATDSEKDRRDEIDDLRAELAELRAMVAECERKHQAATAALAAAGINISPS